MRISLFKHKAEFWEQIKVPNEYGVPTNSLRLVMKAPVAMKQVEGAIEGNITKSINYKTKITMRHVRNSEPINTSMYLVINGVEYDIVSPPDNPWGMNKYTTFDAVVRTKK